MKTRNAFIFGMLVAMILSMTVSAALTVQSFSCNSQSGVVTVEAGGTLTCEASIKNAGSATASVSSITLLTDGVWAESTSYSGLGFTSSLSAGAATTATFGNIRPTTTGLHSFNYIKIDSMTDNTPSSTTVNVIALKNMVLNAPVNASEGDEITVSSSVTSGGNMQITLTLETQNCTLKTGESATRDLGVVADNIVKSASWKVIIGSGKCTYNVRAQGSSGTVSVSKVKSNSLYGGGVEAIKIQMLFGWNLISIPLGL